MLAWQEMRESRGVMSSQLCNDASGIADKIALVKLPACPETGSRPATCALLLASTSGDVVRELPQYSGPRVRPSLHDRGHQIKTNTKSWPQIVSPVAFLL